MGQIWSFLKLVAAAICGGGLVWAATSYSALKLPDASSGVPLATLNMTYTDFVTIMLTCVTVVLAAVGIGVGVVAAYTITNLKKDADAKVDEAVTKRLEGIERVIEQKVSEIAYSVGRNLHHSEDMEEDMEDR